MMDINYSGWLMEDSIHSINRAKERAEKNRQIDYYEAVYC